MGYGAMQLAGPHVFGPPADPDELCGNLGDGGLRRRRIVAGVRSLPEPPEERYACDGRYHDHPIPPAWFDH
jgi:hypothetical protein